MGHLPLHYLKKNMPSLDVNRRLTRKTDSMAD